MRLRRSLVLVAHDDPGVRVAQAADLTGAGYRCLTAGDSDAAIWLAVKFSLEAVPALYPGIVLVSPFPPSERELPPTVTWIDPSAQKDGLIEAVGRASWMQSAQLSRMRVHRQDSTSAPAMATACAETTGRACS
jgi:hypothetical protein